MSICQGSVWVDSRIGLVPCIYKAKVERNGKLYCGVHDPEAIKAREAKRQQTLAAKNSAMTSTNKRDGGEVESDPLDRRLLGRARFLRDRGEIKSPELMEEAERALAESRAEVDRLNELCNGLHRSLTESQAGFVNHRSRAERLAGASRAVCDYDWSDNDDDAVAAVEKLRAALEQEPQE